MNFFRIGARTYKDDSTSLVGIGSRSLVLFVAEVTKRLISSSVVRYCENSWRVSTSVSEVEIEEVGEAVEAMLDLMVLTFWMKKLANSLYCSAGLE